MGVWNFIEFNIEWVFGKIDVECCRVWYVG